jgi:hypothetical protein
MFELPQISMMNKLQGSYEIWGLTYLNTSPTKEEKASMDNGTSMGCRLGSTHPLSKEI